MSKLEKHSPPSIEDISPRDLASELGIEKYEFPAEDVQSATKAFAKIYKIIKSSPVSPKEDLPEFFAQNKQKIFEVFDAFPYAYRFPVYITNQLYNTVAGEDVEVYSNVVDAWRWYACLKSIELDTHFFTKTQFVFPSVFVQQEGTRMLLGAWGRKYGDWVSRLRKDVEFDEAISTRERERERFTRSLSLEQSQVEDIHRQLRAFFASIEESFEFLLISHQSTQNHPEIGIPALNFLLCQRSMHGYISLIQETTKTNPKGIKKCLPLWGEWVKKYFTEIMKEDSEIRKIFYFAFGLEGDLFEKGKISEKLKRKNTVQVRGLPHNLSDILEKLYREEKTREKNFRKSIAAKVTKVIQPKKKIGDYSVLPAVKVQKEKINIPNPSSLFVRGLEKKQLKQLNLSGLSLPEGTTVQFERQAPRNNTFETISVELGQVNEIASILGQDHKGHFIYRLTIILPGEYRFSDSKMKAVLEQKIYAEAEPTLEESEVQKNKKTAPIHSVAAPPKTTTSLTPVVKTVVTSVLETPNFPKQKTLADTVTAWEIAAGEPSFAPELRYDGIVVFHLPGELADELHDASFETLQIGLEGTINPDIGAGDIASQLQDIASELREKKRSESELALQSEQEEAEYQNLRSQFQSLYDFIAEQTFVDKSNKALFEKASEEFRGSLKGLQWGMPWRIAKDGQIQFRHIRNKLKITYSNLGVVINVAGEGRTLSKAEERCYREVAEAFSHLALFYTAEYRERQKMITKEKKFQKDMRQGAEAYEALLSEGRARLVQYSSSEKGNIFISKFPLDDKPQMLPEKVGHDTVEEMLGKHEYTELSYRRDIVRINGEISEDAGEQSLENTLQNLADLRQSPRARYILRKRVLITLGLEKFPEDDRAPIQSEKNGHQKMSAYNILEALREENTIVSVEQINEEFMDRYIDLLIQNRIRIQYIWPLSVSLSEHQKQLEKNQKQKEAIAD